VTMTLSGSAVPLKGFGSDGIARGLVPGQVRLAATAGSAAAWLRRWRP